MFDRPQLIQNKETGTWNVIVNGEWYYEGNYEQAERVFNSFFYEDDEEYYEEDYDYGMD